MRTYRTIAPLLLVSAPLLGCPQKEEAEQTVEEILCVNDECPDGLECFIGVCVPPESVLTDSAVTTDATETTDGTGGASDTSSGGASALNVLFVVDNSGSMGEEQQTLAEGIGQFVDALGEVDVRIAVTTTDNGNVRCSGTSPEQGAFVATSCRDRLDDFVFQGATELDATAACTDWCGEDVALGGSAQPWIERIGGTTNLPDDVDIAQALRCVLPQGINGCGFESPLESMYQALSRAGDSGDANAGFSFEDGTTAVVIISDEVDCSAADDSIFSPDGSRTFWSIPDAGSPTSAVCWNAGVTCDGSGTYSGCYPAYLDEGGNQTSPEAAVLHPLSRYTAMSDTMVFGILGVPQGYPTAPLVYQDSPGGTANDPSFQENFGIGPGCVSEGTEAVPPVRMRDVAEQLGGDEALFSVCDTNYGPALESIAEQIVAAL